MITIFAISPYPNTRSELMAQTARQVPGLCCGSERNLPYMPGWVANVAAPQSFTDADSYIASAKETERHGR